MASSEDIILHGYYRSSAAFRVRIALGLKGIAYTQVPHHLRKGEQRSAEYLALNPQGLVPTLQIDGLALTQSVAAIEYLDETRSTPPLLPADAAGRARVRTIAQVITADIHPIDNLRVLNYLRKDLAQPVDAVKRWYAHWIVQGFDALEGLLTNDSGTGRFCHGDTPGLADICLVPQVINARLQGVDIAAYPVINRIADTALAQPAFRDALPENQPDAE
ncbi:MAG: maleylacetoacetate isomerase [Pseudomonadota bacterium]